MQRAALSREPVRSDFSPTVARNEILPTTQTILERDSSLKNLGKNVAQSTP